MLTDLQRLGFSLVASVLLSPLARQVLLVSTGTGFLLSSPFLSSKYCCCRTLFTAWSLLRGSIEAACCLSGIQFALLFVSRAHEHEAVQRYVFIFRNCSPFPNVMWRCYVLLVPVPFTFEDEVGTFPKTFALVNFHF